MQIYTPVQSKNLLECNFKSHSRFASQISQNHFSLIEERKNNNSKTTGFKNLGQVLKIELLSYGKG